MIYTSYFAQIRNLPNNIIPIAIYGGIPQWYSGLWYKKLAPKYKFFMKWKQNHNNEFYIEHFYNEVLINLVPEEVESELYALLPEDKKNCDIALICYEKPDDFCHRHLVADWMRKAGIPCEEWKKKE